MNIYFYELLTYIHDQYRDKIFQDSNEVDCYLTKNGDLNKFVDHCYVHYAHPKESNNDSFVLQVKDAIAGEYIYNLDNLQTLLTEDFSAQITDMNKRQAIEQSLQRKRFNDKDIPFVLIFNASILGNEYSACSDGNIFATIEKRIQQHQKNDNAIIFYDSSNSDESSNKIKHNKQKSNKGNKKGKKKSEKIKRKTQQRKGSYKENQM